MATQVISTTPDPPEPSSVQPSTRSIRIYTTSRDTIKEKCHDGYLNF